MKFLYEIKDIKDIKIDGIIIFAYNNIDIFSFLNKKFNININKKINNNQYILIRHIYNKQVKDIYVFFIESDIKNIINMFKENIKNIYLFDKKIEYILDDIQLNINIKFI